jgi:hypothetical protein
VYGYTLSLVVTSNTLLVLTSHFHSHARNAVGALADDEARDRGACSTHSLLAFSARHRLGLSPPSLVVPSSSFVSPHTLGSEPAKTHPLYRRVFHTTTHNRQPSPYSPSCVHRNAITPPSCCTNLTRIREVGSLNELACVHIATCSLNGLCWSCRTAPHEGMWRHADSFLCIAADNVPRRSPQSKREKVRPLSSSRNSAPSEMSR